MFKIVIPGGTGHLGTLLATALHARGDEVVVLSRAPGNAPWREVGWDGRTLGPWADEIDGADVVINLAGRSVDCRYHPRNRKAIMDSRVDSTRVLGAAIARAKKRPRTWLQSSTATIYAHRYDAPNDEATGILGGSEPNATDTWRFSIDVAKSWERAFDESIVEGVRAVKMRTAVVLSRYPRGAFDMMRRLARLGLGGRMGDGRQWISWIHHRDFVRAVQWLIARDDFDGIVNIASPNPVPNADFMRILRETCGMRIGLPAPAWMLEIGAALLRTETELILKSRRVVPGRLLEAGFTFELPSWTDAARELCGAAVTPSVSEGPGGPGGAKIPVPSPAQAPR